MHNVRRSPEKIILSQAGLFWSLPENKMSNSIKSNRNIIPHIHEVRIFSGVPFSIENVESHFKGALKRIGDNIEIRYDDNVACIIEESERFMIVCGIRADELPNKEYNLPYPGTLFDFYIDCHRCGIKLEYKT